MIVGAHSVVVLVREDGQHSVLFECSRPGEDSPIASQRGPWESPEDAAKRLRDITSDLADQVVVAERACCRGRRVAGGAPGRETN